MNFGDVVELIPADYAQDVIGNDLAVDGPPRKVFADVRSVSQTEALRAGQSGLSPSFKVLVRRCDYQGEDSVVVEGKRYAVYRTYCVGNITELYLERKAGVYEHQG